MSARVPPAFVTLLAAAALTAGCGSSSLSGSALRAQAARVCRTAAARAERIDRPSDPAAAAQFISAGLSAFDPPLASLRRLRPPSAGADDYRDALAAFSAEVAALRSTLKGLHDGDDPVLAIKTLQQELTPSESRARAAWDALDVPACGALTT